MDTCESTQSDFLAMGCAERGESSSQCVIRAVDFAKNCGCDGPDVASLRFPLLLNVFAMLITFAHIVSMLDCRTRAHDED